MRWLPIFLCAALAGCAAPLTPEGSRVAVFEAPPDGSARHGMPAECRLLLSSKPIAITELEIEGQRDPFRDERNRAGAAGANVLLVLKTMTVGRRDMDCPSASRITDCPPSSGAWYRVVFESYGCPAGTQIGRGLPAVPNRE